MKKITILGKEIPGIGMRILKSALAVGICYLIDGLRAGQGMVFYSQLAALWCIQMYRSNTRQNALQRTTGTLVGAVYGLFFLLLLPTFPQGEPARRFFGEAVIVFMIVLVLYTTVFLQKKPAAYFSCVVFLSIVVNHGNDLNPYLFVWNRFLDTMIGILVGIAVNDIRLCLHPDRNTLFVSGLDDTLLNQKEMLSAFSAVELNRMLDDGLKFTVSTMRTPAAIMEPMKDVRLSLPVIAMNGAVLYDTNKHAYLKVYVISKETSQRLMEYISQTDLSWYANVIVEDTLLIYHNETKDPINRELVEKLRVSPYRNYIRRPLPMEESVVYYMLLDRTEKITAFYERLSEEGFTDILRILCYPSTDYKGYSYIKIYNRNASKENMIRYLQEQVGAEKVITFGTIPGQYHVLISGEDGNRVVREVRKRYEPIGK